MKSIFLAAVIMGMLGLGGCASFSGGMTDYTPYSPTSHVYVSRIGTDQPGAVAAIPYTGQPLSVVESWYAKDGGGAWPTDAAGRRYIPATIYSGFSDTLGGGVWPRFIVPVPPAAHLRVGDYIQFRWPAAGKVAVFEKVLTRWDDPSPTGCRPLANYGMISAHWSGGIQCGVLDPDGPQKRRDMRGWLLFGHRIYNAS